MVQELEAAMVEMNGRKYEEICKLNRLSCQTLKPCGNGRCVHYDGTRFHNCSLLGKCAYNVGFLLMCKGYKDKDEKINSET